MFARQHVPTAAVCLLSVHLPACIYMYQYSNRPGKAPVTEHRLDGLTPFRAIATVIMLLVNVLLLTTRTSSGSRRISHWDSPPPH
ncbi:hypothetical protein V8C86DRAFT_190796 [Haematococcus lacustris]